MAIAPAIQPRAGRAAVSAVYEDLAELVSNTARSFAAKHCMDPDECESEAALIFLRAYHTFDASKGPKDRPAGYKLRIRVRQLIWFRLRDRAREDINRRGVLRTRQIEHADRNLRAPKQTPAFDRAGFLNDLSADARTVVELLFESLPEITAAIGPTDPVADRTVLQWFLAGMGWGRDRIQAAFLEVGGAL